MTTYDFTANEAAAVKALYASCLDAMGGACYADLESDPYTWVDAGDLRAAGWSRHEAAGTFGALIEKGAVQHWEGKDHVLHMSAAKWASEN